MLVSQPDNVINTASVKMAIYAKGKEKHKEVKEPQNITLQSEISFHQFCYYSALFLVDNSLTIHCEVCVFMLADVMHVTGSRYSVTVPECDMCTHFGSLLSSEEFSDVTLVVGMTEVKAHKLVLSTRSPVFKTMFQVDMKEKLTNRVKIEDVELPALQEMLTFMYTGKSPNLKSMTSELLFPADKYQLDRLKLMCEEELCSKLNLTNASQTLELPDRHNATQLIEYCRDFIARHEAVRHGTVRQAPFQFEAPTDLFKKPRLD